MLAPKYSYFTPCMQKKSEGIKEIEMLNSSTDVPTSAEIYKPAFANSFISESIVLGQRNLLNIFRSKELFLGRVGLMVCSTILLPSLSRNKGNYL